MRRFFLIFWLQILVGQRAQTIPQNVFRFSMGTSFSEQSWDFDKQSFNFSGIGEHYFNRSIHSDSLRFSSNHDLYYNGSMALDSSTTIENWLTGFNETYGSSLPTLGAQAIDTSMAIQLIGEFLESRKRTLKRQKINIEYGLSNEVTVGVSMPYFSDYSLDRTLSNVTASSIDGVEILINSHTGFMSDFNTFMNSDSYESIPSVTRDTLEMIYDLFYSKSSEYSVRWIDHAQNDPINNLLLHDQFIPASLGKDTVSLSDLVSYYYPTNRKTSSLGDFEFGGTVLISGDPHWSSRKPKKAVYGQIIYSLPFIKTRSSYLKSGSSQFKELITSVGMGQWTFGLLGEFATKGKTRGYSNFGLKIKTNSSEILNTPIELFSGGHTNPDSIVSRIGDTYKYDPGTWVMFDFGMSLETIKNRLWVQAGLHTSFKGQDTYVSKNKEWDKWMQSHLGYDSAQQSTLIQIELLGINSYSKNRIGPFSFDVYAGIKQHLFANNTYQGFMVYSGLTTYYQSW